MNTFRLSLSSITLQRWRLIYSALLTATGLFFLQHWLVARSRCQAHLNFLAAQRRIYTSNLESPTKSSPTTNRFVEARGRRRARATAEPALRARGHAFGRQSFVRSSEEAPKSAPPVDLSFLCPTPSLLTLSPSRFSSWLLLVLSCLAFYIFSLFCCFYSPFFSHPNIIII